MISGKIPVIIACSTGAEVNSSGSWFVTDYVWMDAVPGINIYFVIVCNSSGTQGENAAKHHWRKIYLAFPFVQNSKTHKRTIIN